MAKVGWGKILAGVATAAAAGAAYIYFKQRAAKTMLYERVSSDGAFEVRRYPAMLAIQTIQHGSRDRALGNGFGLLAGYMFGEGREGEEIPITMPVLAESLADGAWRISFLIPEGHDRASLVPPSQGIVIGGIPAREVAVVSVPGKPSDRLFAAKTAELRQWIEAGQMTAASTVEHGYYNSPLEPGPARPNEILIPLAA